MLMKNVLFQPVLSGQTLFVINSLLLCARLPSPFGKDMVLPAIFCLPSVLNIALNAPHLSLLCQWKQMPPCVACFHFEHSILLLLSKVTSYYFWRIRIRSKALSEGFCLSASVACRESFHARLLIPARYRRHSLWATAPNKYISAPFHRLPFWKRVPNIKIWNRLLAHRKCKRHHILR